MTGTCRTGVEGGVVVVVVGVVAIIINLKKDWKCVNLGVVIARALLVFFF